MAFRFDEDFINQIKIGLAQHRSLNNYIDVLLLRDIGNIAKKETQAATKEVMSGKELEELKDINSFMMNSL